MYEKNCTKVPTIPRFCTNHWREITHENCLIHSLCVCFVGLPKSAKNLSFSHNSNGRWVLFSSYRSMSINEKFHKRDFYPKREIVSFHKPFICFTLCASVWWACARAPVRSPVNSHIECGLKTRNNMFEKTKSNTHVLLFTLFYSINLNSITDKIIDYYCSKFVRANTQKA